MPGPILGARKVSALILDSSHGNDALAGETTHDGAHFIAAGFGEAKGLMGVEILAGDKLHESFLLEIFHRAGGVGRFAAVAVQPDV